MKPHEIKEATSWPTAHQADKRVKVHCRTNASFYIWRTTVKTYLMGLRDVFQVYGTLNTKLWNVPTKCVYEPSTGRLKTKS